MGTLAINVAPEAGSVEIPGYPKAQAYRSGGKVSWLYFANKADAYKAKATAEEVRTVMQDRGYDFGYQVPGSITRMRVGPYQGLYEVCLP